MIPSTCVNYSFIALLTATWLLETAVQAITFQSLALSQKTSCAELSKDDCLFYEEAIQLCADDCKKKAICGDQAGAGGASPAGAAPGGAGPAAGLASLSALAGAGKKGCFHGGEVVYTRAGPIKIKDLVTKADVEVLTRNDQGIASYSPIYYWIHANGEQFYEFLELKFKSGNQLLITKDHLIYRIDQDGSKQAIFAGRLKIGDHLLVHGRNGTFFRSQIVSRNIVTKQGFYSPITRQGNIVVSGVLASCFVCLENEVVQKIMYSYLSAVHRVISMLMPRMIVEVFFSTSFGREITVPEVVFSFWDIGKLIIMNR